jgi:CHAD domain-containing protein
MTYRLEPLSSVDQSVRRIALSQIEDLLAEHGQGAASPVAVHEARKALKRLRALLSLIRSALDEKDLQREKQRLRSIAGTLAGARDAHVMIETAKALSKGDMLRSCEATAGALMTLLEEKRGEAERQFSGHAVRLPVDQFQEARSALEALPLDDLGFEQVLDGFVATYRRGRKLFAAVFKADVEDERYHDLRKAVQQHWRHLQLLSNAWPKALRPQVALAHELAEALGRDHDLSVLSAFVRDNAGRIGEDRDLETYLQLCATSQKDLREEASLLARRLYAEKPKAIRERMRTYWLTARELEKAKPAKAERTSKGKAVAFS